jgi:hypothetical protein
MYRSRKGGCDTACEAPPIPQSISRSTGRNEFGGAGSTIQNVSFLNLSSLNTTMITASSATFQNINSYALDIVQLSGYALQGPLDGNYQQAQHLFIKESSITDSVLTNSLMNNCLIGTTLAVGATFTDLFTFGRHLWSGSTYTSWYDNEMGQLSIAGSIQVPLLASTSLKLVSSEQALLLDSRQIDIPQTLFVGSQTLFGNEGFIDPTTAGKLVLGTTTASLHLETPNLVLPAREVYRWYSYNDTLENNGVWTSGIQTYHSTDMGSTGLPVFGWSREADPTLETILTIDMTEDLRTEQMKGFYLEEVFVSFDVLDAPCAILEMSLHTVDHQQWSGHSVPLSWSIPPGSIPPGHHYRRAIVPIASRPFETKTVHSVSLQARIQTNSNAVLVWYGCHGKWKEKGW